jgi:hypothetical protein
MPTAVLCFGITVAQMPVPQAAAPVGTPRSPIEPEGIFHPPRC